MKPSEYATRTGCNQYFDLLPNVESTLCGLLMCQTSRAYPAAGRGNVAHDCTDGRFQIASEYARNSLVSNSGR